MMNNSKKQEFQKINPQIGQAVISLLFVMTISIAIITAIVIIVLNSVTAASNFEQGTVAFYAAETGFENALLRLLRDPNYSGETLNVDQGSVTIQVDGGTITSTANVANSIRKIEVETLYNENVLTVTSWKEIN